MLSLHYWYGRVEMSGTETQNSILDAVQAIIVRDGVAGTSMRQIAEEADVSLGLISYHFDDKDRLILATFERATAALRGASQRAADEVDDPAEKVRAFLRGSFTEEFLNSDYLRLRVSLWAVALTEAEIATVDLEYSRLYESALEALLQSALPDTDPREVASRCWQAIALTNGLWLEWARYGDDESLERGLVLAENVLFG